MSHLKKKISLQVSVVADEIVCIAICQNFFLSHKIFDQEAILSLNIQQVGNVFWSRYLF